MSRRLQVNSPGVVAEVIDGEAVIMNLVSGHYFSAQGVGAYTWSLLESGSSEQAIASALAAHFALPAEDTARHVAAFVADLERHQLMVPGSATANAHGSAVQLPRAWSPPVLNVFTDMEDLLLLDPIHDVGEAGWPMPKAVDDPS